VIIYDSLSARGHVEYANALAPQNKPLFDACDGIFLNYWWNPGNEERPTLLKQSRELAGMARYVPFTCKAKDHCKTASSLRSAS
jgi:mannosyl-glycoprotein endo-beta-N-acetylglucosaminidase